MGIIERAVERTKKQVKRVKRCPFCTRKQAPNRPSCRHHWMKASPAARRQWLSTFKALGIGARTPWNKVVRKVGVQEAGERLRRHNESAQRLIGEILNAEGVR